MGAGRIDSHMGGCGHHPGKLEIGARIRRDTGFTQKSMAGSGSRMRNGVRFLIIMDGGPTRRIAGSGFLTTHGVRPGWTGVRMTTI